MLVVTNPKVNVPPGEDALLRGESRRPPSYPKSTPAPFHRRVSRCLHERLGPGGSLGA
jgi:hypothetical protein